MDLDPHILQIEPPEEVHYLLGCCVQWPLTKSARLVAYISLISAICNLCIMLFAQEASLHVVVDGIILAVEFFCVFSLFYGINKKKARALKPFIVCGTIWNAFLAILWLCCVIQLFDRDKFTSEVLSNLSQMFNLSPQSDGGFWMSLVLVLLLGLTTLMGIWFLHIVIITYYYFIDRQEEIWKKQPETRRLIQPEMNNLLSTKTSNVNTEFSL